MHLILTKMNLFRTFTLALTVVLSFCTHGWSGTVFLYDAHAEESSWEDVLPKPYLHVPPRKFGGGEQRVQIKLPSPVPERMVMVGSVTNNDTLMHALLVANALKRSGAQDITAVIPYLAYMRQDRPKDGEPASAEVIIQMLEQHIDRFITIDLHSTRNAACFKKPLKLLSAAPLFAKDIEKFSETLHEKIIVSPDQGGAMRAQAVADLCTSPTLTLYKERTERNVQALPITENIRGKTCFVIDDMVDSGGTLLEACRALKRAEAFSVHAYCTHAVCSPAFNKCFPNEVIDSLTVTNSFPVGVGGVKVLPLASLLQGVLDLSLDMD